MSKMLDLSKSVYEICTEYPEAIDIMAGLGFKDITKPMALSTMGKMMTIPRGALIKGVDMNEIIKAFQDAGFVIGKPMDDRVVKIKDYIKRLTQGEDIDSVRKDFVENFEDVDASEIARAEQEIIKQGTPVSDVQKLCDVHSALFHGRTREEQIQNAEAAVNKSLKMQHERNLKTAKNLEEFRKIEGHPVNVFINENEVIKTLITNLRKVLNSLNDPSDMPEDEIRKVKDALNEVRNVQIHYARKGDLIYPVLKRDYKFSGPSDVMWGVDDEIRDELGLIYRSIPTLDDWKERLEAVLRRADEMIYKENSILFPLCMERFDEKTWMRIYYEMPSYRSLLQGDYPIWKEAEDARDKYETVGGVVKEEYKESASIGADDFITLGSGHMKRHQIEKVLDTIPLEISFVDENDINRYFNDGPDEKYFKRPDMAIDKSVYQCHPPQIEMMVKSVISDLKSGKKDSVDVWLEKYGEPCLVRYMAVRDDDASYVGTMEVVQKMGFARDHFLK